MMLYMGCDVHKNSTVVSFINEDGKVKDRGRFYNDEKTLERLLKRFPEEEFSAVLEAGLNWGVIHDLLEKHDRVKEVSVAHTPKVKAIASAKIKTDKIDSTILGKLLRTGLIPEIWIPSKEVRAKKYLVRHRAFIVKVKTIVKNRVHDVLRKSHQTPPDVKDIFGVYGREWMDSIKLSDEREDRILRSHLRLYDFLFEEEKEIRKLIRKEMKGDKDLKLVKTIPGIGEVFGPIIVLEIDDINRFPDPAHLHSYSGLVPSTHSSANKLYHGKLIKGNKWLRWAFIEGIHTSIQVSPYFREHYNRVMRNAGKNGASVSTARKLATVTYHVLKEKREYIENYEEDKKGRSPSEKISQVEPGSILE